VHTIYSFRKALKKLNIEKYTKNGSTWIDLQQPTKAELTFLKNQIKLHPITLEDIQSISTPVKYESFDDYHFIVFKGIKKVHRHSVDACRIYFIITKDLLITVHDLLIDSIENQKNDEKKLSDLLNKGTDYLLHNLLDMEVDNYFPFVKKLEKEIDKLDDLISHDPEHKNFDELFDKKSIMQSIRRSLTSLTEIFAKILRSEKYVRPEVLVYFRDVYDHIIRLDQSLLRSRDQISSTVSEHLAVSSTRMNDIIKILTMITTLLMPLSLITGLYGMNVPLPGQGNTSALIVIFIVMLIISISMLIFFRKKKWI